MDEEEFFADLDGLIEHYKKAADGLCTKLVKPLIKQGGAEFKIEISNRNGELINNKADMPFLLQSQQIFGRGNVTRLTQFSLTQRLLDDQLSIKLGRIYPSADFFAMSCAFQHLTFCSGGSSNYISSSWYGDPLSSLGVQVTYNLSDNLILKAGDYDANPETIELLAECSNDSGIDQDEI